MNFFSKFSELDFFELPNSEISQLRQEQKVFRAELNSKLDALLEALQSLSLQMAARPSNYIKKDPAVQLPNLPFNIADEINEFHVRLNDSVYMEQMVTNS